MTDEKDMAKQLKYRAGDVVTLKVARLGEMGAFLDAGTGDTSDDILLHKLQQTEAVNVGDEVKVYLYKDPHALSPRFARNHFGRFAPYFERRCLRFFTPWVSSTPRRMW